MSSFMFDFVIDMGGMMNVLSGATLFCKITHAPNIFMICVHRDSLVRDYVYLTNQDLVLLDQLESWII